MTRPIEEIEADLKAAEAARDEVWAARRKARRPSWDGEHEAWQRVRTLRAELKQAKEAQR